MNKKIGILGGALIIALLVMGVGFFLNRGNKATSPIVETNQANQEMLDIGKPSEGTTYIEQRIDAENPYTVKDQKAIENYAKTNEGHLIGKLFDNLNSQVETQVLNDLREVPLGEVLTNTKISADFQAMLWGYRSLDDRERFLYDANIMKNFQPHKDLLVYLQTLRTNSQVKVKRIGQLVPDLMKSGSNMVTVNEDSYLIQEEAGSVLLQKTDGLETSYYLAKFDLYIAIPRGMDAVGKPYYIWHQELNINVEPVADNDVDQLKKDHLS